MSHSTDDLALWNVAPSCVGSASIDDPEVVEDSDLLEAVWAAAHTTEPVDGWSDLRVRTEDPEPSAVLYVEEAEVLVYADAVRSAVEGVGGAASDHVWFPVTVLDPDGSEARYWLLSCRVPDAELPDGRVDPAVARDAAVVHYAVGDNFPAFSGAARAAVETAVADVVFEQANPSSTTGA